MPQDVAQELLFIALVLKVLLLIFDSEMVSYDLSIRTCSSSDGFAAGRGLSEPA